MKITPTFLLLALLGCGSGTQPARSVTETGKNQTHVQKAATLTSTTPTEKAATTTSKTPDADSLLDPYETYSIKKTLDTARGLQMDGREKAIAKLKMWAKANREPQSWVEADQDLKSWVRVERDELRMIVMCRMLFKGEQASLRRPFIGHANFIGGTTYDDWPMEPVAIYEGIPILITQSYRVVGEVLPAEAYLSYCVQQGSWVSEKYEDKNLEQINASLSSFLTATKWKKGLSNSERQFVMSQNR